MNDALSSPPVPVPDADSIGYWEAAKQGRLVVCRCQECRRWMHPPLEACRHCGAPTQFEEISGRGTVFTFIVVRHQSVPGHEVPYVVGIVELEEQQGLRLTGVIDAEPEAVSCGLAVQAKLVEVGSSGYSTPEFVLTG